MWTGFYGAATGTSLNAVARGIVGSVIPALATSAWATAWCPHSSRPCGHAVYRHRAEPQQGVAQRARKEVDFNVRYCAKLRLVLFRQKPQFARRCGCERHQRGKTIVLGDDADTIAPYQRWSCPQRGDYDSTCFGDVDLRRLGLFSPSSLCPVSSFTSSSLAPFGRRFSLTSTCCWKPDEDLKPASGWRAADRCALPLSLERCIVSVAIALHSSTAPKGNPE